MEVYTSSHASTPPWHAEHPGLCARQAQLPLWPVHQEAVAQCVDLWGETLRRWGSSAQAAARLPLIIDLPSALHPKTSDGADVSDRWAETLRLRGLLERRWSAAMCAQSKQAGQTFGFLTSEGPRTGIQ